MKKIFCTSFLLLTLCFVPRVQAANEIDNEMVPNALLTIDAVVVDDLVDLGVFAVTTNGTTNIANGVTRAEFVQVIMQYLHHNAATNSRCFDLLDPDMRPGFGYRYLFSDVDVYAPYATELCTAMITGVVNGYEDGSFRPNDLISFAEAAKIINVAFGLDYVMPDYDTELWYGTYVHQLELRDAVPDSVKNYIEEMTREEVTETVTSVLQSLRENPVTYPNEWPR